MTTKSFTERLYEHFEAVHREFAGKSGGRIKTEPAWAIEAVGRLLDEIAADAAVAGKLKEGSDG